MNYNILENIQYCKEFVDPIITLIYYSHAVPAGVALLVGLFVYLHNRKLLLGKILIFFSIIFSVWIYLNLSIWVNYDKGGVVMYAWAPIEILSVLLFILAFYFVYVFIEGKDVSLKWKFLSFALVAPIIIAVPTAFNLTGYDIQECIALENGLYLYYVNALKILFAATTLIFALYKFFINKKSRAQIMLLTLGIGIFLYSRLISGYISEQTLDFRYEFYGMFGMIAFIGILAYLIVKYRVFNIKLAAAQALVMVLIILVGAQFFFVRNTISIILTGVTLLSVLIFGYLLIRSVKREVKLREDLEVANEGQANLIHIMNHQIKGYLSKSRNIFSELLAEPSYNACTEEARPMLQEGFKSLTEGVNFITDFLNASNIEKGSYQYKMEPVDFKLLVVEVTEKQKEVAKEKGLTLDLQVSEGNYSIIGDVMQLGQTVRNLIDNSIRYTPSGSINAKLSTNNSKILFTIQDTGVGISDELKPKLFTKGGRDRDSLKININSTGFGLAFVKGVAEAHKGRVWAESPGVGKGSTFYLELPIS